MLLPTLATVQQLLQNGSPVRERVLRIAKRLEALNEYSPEQALRVAADIVQSSIKRSTRVELTR